MNTEVVQDRKDNSERMQVHSMISFTVSGCQNDTTIQLSTLPALASFLRSIRSRFGSSVLVVILSAAMASVLVIHCDMFSTLPFALLVCRVICHSCCAFQCSPPLLSHYVALALPCLLPFSVLYASAIPFAHSITPRKRRALSHLAAFSCSQSFHPRLFSVFFSSQSHRLQCLHKQISFLFSHR